MKKILLSALTLCGMMFASYAQDFTDGATGFIVDYTGTDANFANCLAAQPLPNNGGFQYAGGNISNPTNAPQLMLSGTKFLNLTAIATVDPALDPGYFDIYTSQSGNCNPMRTDGAIGIDMTSNPKISITAKSNTAGAKIRIYLGASTSGFPANTFGSVAAPIVAEATLTTSYATYTFDLSTLGGSNWTSFSGKNNVNMLGFTLATDGATYQVSKVALGDQVLSTNAAILPSNVKYYPNPASTNITVENINVSSMKLMDVNGVVVRETAASNVSVEGLTSGLYFLQINGFKPVKVMVK